MAHSSFCQVNNHDFSRAAKPFISCHSERASAREESAFSLFQQPSLAGDTELGRGYEDRLNENHASALLRR